MSDLVIGLTSALWLGILTSISPCPLATNIAAISYLSKNIVHIKTVLRSGIAYTLGRMIAYAVLGFIIVNALLTVPVIAQFLQNYSLAQKGGVTGSFALGFLFALSFCPISAALFFGSLIPLALQNKFGTTLPFMYGLGTGLPVLFFSVCIAIGAQSITRWFHRVSKLEYYTRKITGVMFILVGLYYIWAHYVLSMLV